MPRSQKEMSSFFFQTMVGGDKELYSTIVLGSCRAVHKTVRTKRNAQRIHKKNDKTERKTDINTC